MCNFEKMLELELDLKAQAKSKKQPKIGQNFVYMPKTSPKKALRITHLTRFLYLGR